MPQFDRIVDSLTEDEYKQMKSYIDEVDRYRLSEKGKEIYDNTSTIIELYEERRMKNEQKNVQG